MSVNTSEEYLDELLQAIEPIIGLNESVQKTAIDVNGNEQAESTSLSMEEDMGQEVSFGEEMNFSDAEATSEVMSEMMNEVTPETMPEMANGAMPETMPEMANGAMPETTPEMVNEAKADTAEESVTMDELLAALTSEESAEVEELSVSEDDVDAMLSAAVNASEADMQETTSHDEDVKELLKQFVDDEDLTNINDILERHDNNEAVDEAILVTPDVEVFQLEESEEQEKEDTEEKKGIFGFLRKKKKKNNKTEDTVADEKNRDASAGGIEKEFLDAPKADVEVEMDITGLVGLEDISEDVSQTDSVEGDISLDSLFADNDASDIDLLLSGGVFTDNGNKQELGESVNGDGEKKNKKEGKKDSFFAKIMNLLLEEEEEETPKKSKVPEADATGVTEENVAILDELSKEDKKKARLEKKEQKKKEKEAKKKGKNATEGEAGDDEQADEKSKKKKQKVKKEKPRDVVDLDAKPERKLSRKKVSVIFALCFSILAMILILQNVVLDLSNLKAARWAFDNADYATCYANLYGEELSGEDEAIFRKSYVILCVQRKWDSYENLRQMDMDVEALNALFEGVRVYREMEPYAEELGISNRISGIYRTIYDTLSGYGLSDNDIEEILGYESKVTYTKRLHSIINGTPFEVSDMSDFNEDNVVEEPQTIVFEDILPQEEDFLPDDAAWLNTMGYIEDELNGEEKASESQGNTVVVGSAPVDISGASQSGENSSTDGTNVGDGNTDLSASVSGENVFVN